MSGIAKLKKDELRIEAEEIGLVVSEDMKKSELRRLIEDSDVLKNDNEAVKSAVEDVLENRNKKSDQDGEIEIERLKIERIKLELKLAQVKANGNNTSFDQGCKNEPEESLDSLIKSVKTLTIKPPSVEATLANLRTQFWVTNEFQGSETQQIKKLFSDFHLGDKKPSFLLRQMQDLSLNKVTEDFLKILWMQRLPVNVQAILSAATENLTQLAQLADKIYEFASD
ncbi:DUF1758 domain-containing protein [Nephila pilipes]|uniref:DUF1758 domain-containing protein n=1 Tax=Nephila pilipes TaxID=299642 RepID=A0A8X6TZU8_NEPPI|nr:DUF1758 domain-containing protein [Nephila pilipes]